MKLNKIILLCICLFVSMTFLVSAVPYNVTTGSYNGNYFSVNDKDGTMTGLFFKSDGTRMFMVGQANDRVFSYTLGTAWDVTTAVYDDMNLSISAREGSVNGLYFKDDGTKMYIVGMANDIVVEYDLSSAWNVSSGVYSVNKSISAQDGTSGGLTFKDDGTKMFMVGQGNDKVYSYDLSSAWNVATATFNTSANLSIGTYEGIASGIYFKSDGTILYLVGNSNDRVFTYNLATPWTPSTGVYSDYLYIGGTGEFNPEEVFFNNDGTKLYVGGTVNDKIYEYSMPVVSVVGEHPLHQPLDLEYWLVTVFSGTSEIFSIIAMLVIVFLSAKFRLPVIVLIAFMALFAVFMTTLYGVNTILLIIILIGGLIGYTILRKAQD